MASKEEIHQLICEERTRQDAKWGGAAHDTAHNPSDWATFLARKVNEAEEATLNIWVASTLARRNPEAERLFRKYCIQIAALCYAALETGNYDE